MINTFSRAASQPGATSRRWPLRSVALAPAGSKATRSRVFAEPIKSATKRDARPKGWLDKLKFWKSEEKDKPEQYRVLVTQHDPESFVTVQDPAGVADRTANGDKILALLQDQLK